MSREKVLYPKSGSGTYKYPKYIAGPAEPNFLIAHYASILEPAPGLKLCLECTQSSNFLYFLMPGMWTGKNSLGQLQALTKDVTDTFRAQCPGRRE
jgi:hypothetical protein